VHDHYDGWIDPDFVITNQQRRVLRREQGSWTRIFTVGTGRGQVNFSSKNMRYRVRIQTQIAVQKMGNYAVTSFGDTGVESWGVSKQQSGQVAHGRRTASRYFPNGNKKPTARKKGRQKWNSHRAPRHYGNTPRRLNPRPNHGPDVNAHQQAARNGIKIFAIGDWVLKLLKGKFGRRSFPYRKLLKYLRSRKDVRVMIVREEYTSIECSSCIDRRPNVTQLAAKMQKQGYQYPSPNPSVTLKGGRRIPRCPSVQTLQEEGNAQAEAHLATKIPTRKVLRCNRCCRFWKRDNNGARNIFRLAMMELVLGKGARPLALCPSLL
jgi:hypothetical protein